MTIRNKAKTTRSRSIKKLLDRWITKQRNAEKALLLSLGNQEIEVPTPLRK